MSFFNESNEVTNIDSITTCFVDATEKYFWSPPCTKGKPCPAAILSNHPTPCFAPVLKSGRSGQQYQPTVHCTKVSLWFVYISCGCCFSETLLSASQNILLVPRYKRSGLGRRAFNVAGPLVWNSIADCLRDPALELASFKRQLRTFRPLLGTTYRAH